jgi:hypothetical protein
MLRTLLVLASLLTLALGGCSESGQTAAQPEPKPGESVRIRGILGADADCRLLRAESGRTYALAGHFPNYVNGQRVCVFGTVATLSQCLHSPAIDVDQIRAWGACP